MSPPVIDHPEPPVLAVLHVGNSLVQDAVGHGVADVAQAVKGLLCRHKSLLTALDFSGIDLELGSPALDQVLLEDGESVLDGEGLENAVLVTGDAEGHGSDRDWSVGGLVEGVAVDVDGTDILAHLDIRNLGEDRNGETLDSVYTRLVKTFFNFCYVYKNCLSF